MYKYLKYHEKFIRDMLDSQTNEFDFEYLSEFHKKQIEFMQHERLVHLLVTLAFGFFLIISLAITALGISDVFALFDFLVLILLIPYIIHYFRLENGVQRMYHLANEIEFRLGKVPVNYQIKKEK
jgi:hypothetical protein